MEVSSSNKSDGLDDILKQSQAAESPRTNNKTY